MVGQTYQVGIAAVAIEAVIILGRSKINKEVVYRKRERRNSKEQMRPISHRLSTAGS